MSQLTQLGDSGYLKSMMQDWDGALAVWDEAIKRYPREKRFYNNRACCHLQKKNIKSAYADAVYLTSNFPDYARGHFRMGEILAMMGRHREAEASFKRVLALDPSCEEAHKELKEIQIQQLQALGFSRYQAGNALDFASSFDQAKSILKVGVIPVNDMDLYHSDDEDTYDKYTDSTNPLKCVSLWVGNIVEKVTEAELKKVFSRFGRINKVHVNSNSSNPNACNSSVYQAFVNFFDPESAAKAMRELQGRELGSNKNIILRWTDKEMADKKGK